MRRDAPVRGGGNYIVSVDSARGVIELPKKHLQRGRRKLRNELRLRRKKFLLLFGYPRGCGCTHVELFCVYKRARAQKKSTKFGARGMQTEKVNYLLIHVHLECPLTSSLSDNERINEQAHYEIMRPALRAATILHNLFTFMLMRTAL